MRWLSYLFYMASHLVVTFCYSSSLQLYNDSPYKLDAVVINTLGDVVGLETLKPGEQKYWNQDTSGILIQFNKVSVPYTVVWYCQEGKEYGIWTLATPGSRVSPQLSDGPKICKMRKPQEKLDKFEGKPNPVLLGP